MRRTILVLLGVSLVSSGVLTGCNDDEEPNVGCAVDGDCRGERVCVDGVCEVPEGGEDGGVTSGQDTGVTVEDSGESVDSSAGDVPGDVLEEDAGCECASTYDCCAQQWICHDADNPPVTCALACSPPQETNTCGCQGGDVCEYGPEPGNIICMEAVRHLLDECGYELETIREELPRDYELISQMQEGCFGSFLICYANCMAYPQEDECSACHFGEPFCERSAFDECVQECPRGEPETLCAITGGSWDDSDCADCCGPTRCGEDPELFCADPCCGAPQCACPEQAPFWSDETGCFAAQSCYPGLSCPPGAPGEGQVTTPVITTDPEAFLGQEVTVVGTLTTQFSVTCDDLGPCGTCYPGLTLDGVIGLRGPEGPAQELCGEAVGCREAEDSCLPVWDCFPEGIGRRVRVRGTFEPLSIDSISNNPWLRLLDRYVLTIQGIEVISPVASGGRFAGTLTVDEVAGSGCGEVVDQAPLEMVVAVSSAGIMVEFMAPGFPTGGWLPVMSGWHTGQIGPELSDFSVDDGFLGSFSGRFVEGGIEGIYNASLSGPDCRVSATFRGEQVY